MASRKERARQSNAPSAAKAERPAARLLALLLIAFTVKALVLAHFHDHPLLQPDSGLDSEAYVKMAARVASGDWLLGNEPFFVSPLYIYFLAPIFGLTGGSLLAARVVQILLGTAAAGLLFSAARRFFGERAAAIGTALYLLTGVVSLHEVLILQAALDPFLTALFLFLIAVGLTSGSFSSKVNGTEAGAPGGAHPGAAGWRCWFAAGVAGGLLALNRPNALLCVPAIAVALAAAPLVARRRGGQPLLPFEENPLRTLRFAVTFLAGTAVAIAPVSIRNLVVSGEPVLISSHGGLNLAIGNGPGADGTYRLLPGITPSIEGQTRDAKRVAEAAAGRPLSTREVSAHFSRLALDWMRAHPGDAALLFLRKVGLLLNRVEVPLNLSYPWFEREELSLLSFLVVGAGLLVPLGLLGLGLRLAERPRTAFVVWVSFVPVYTFSVALFFVSSRYRLPLYLPLAAGAGFAIDRLMRAAKAGEKRLLALSFAALFPLAFLAFRPTGIDDGRANEETEMVLWEIEAGKEDAARERLKRLAPRHPLPGVMWFRAGRAWLEARRFEEAAAAFRRSLDIDPGQPETILFLAQTLLSKDDIPGALRTFQTLPASALGDEASAHAEAAGLALAEAGREAEAIPLLFEACRLAPARPSAHQNLATLLAEMGRDAEARTHAQEALRLKPGYPQAEKLLKALR